MNKQTVLAFVFAAAAGAVLAQSTTGGSGAGAGSTSSGGAAGSPTVPDSSTAPSAGPPSNSAGMNGPSETGTTPRHCNSGADSASDCEESVSHPRSEDSGSSR